MQKRLLHIILLYFAINSLQTQNTVGTITYDPEHSSNGYHLFYPNNGSTVFLIDPCGRLINEWDDNYTNSRPGINAYLTDDGNLVRAKTQNNLNGSSFGTGGSGGIIEIRSWDNELLYQRTIADSIFRQHHDIHVMPNGNILAIVYEKILFDELVEMGFDTISNIQKDLWFDCVFEIDPQQDEIVWEWHSVDHIIQDFDGTKSNFGDLLENPQLFDVNYQEYSFGRADFMHANSIDYNEELDQILLSVRNYQELWIIDHSTSTLEASSSLGGLSGRGGDILYRWGNPSTYTKDSINVLYTRRLFNQHDAKWITDPNSEYEGQILLFNNYGGAPYSRGNIISPRFDESLWSYELENKIFLPDNFSLTIQHPDAIRNHSANGSSIQLLTNGNFFMTAAQQGRGFEITKEGQVVWEYVVPMIGNAFVPQGTELMLSQNYTFQIAQYPNDFIGFEDKDLSPKNYLEINPNEEFCDELISVTDLNNDISVYPNPIKDVINITSSHSDHLKIIDLHGKVIKSFQVYPTLSNTVDLTSLNPGIYFLLSSKKSITITKLIKL